VQQQAILWPSLSRISVAIAAFNVSLFFLNGAVKTGGYFYPLISLSLIAIVTILTLLPLGQHARLWFYLLMLTLCGVAGWLLGASIIYWLHSVS